MTAASPLAPAAVADVIVSASMSIVAARGELDLVTEPALREAFDEALGASPVLVCVDLRDVEFADSRAVRALLELRRRCLADGRRLMIVRGPRQVQRVLALCGLVDGDGVEMVERPDSPLGDPAPLRIAAPAAAV